MPDALRRVIASNIRYCREQRFPGKGGSKRCADALGISQQQWSPWERGSRTPDESRLEKIANFFGTSVEWMRERHAFQDEGDRFFYDLKVDEIGPFFRRLEKALMTPCSDDVTIVVSLAIKREAIPLKPESNIKPVA